MNWINITVTLLLALLSGMGIGTGGLLVLYLTLVGQYSQLQAQGINLLFYLFAAGASLLVHLSRRRIPALAVALMILAGVPGALLGAKVALSIPQELTARLFGVFLVVLGLRGLGSLRSTKAHQEGENSEK